jgi:hypothetical protein
MLTLTEIAEDPLVLERRLDLPRHSGVATRRHGGVATAASVRTWCACSSQRLSWSLSATGPSSQRPLPVTRHSSRVNRNIRVFHRTPRLQGLPVRPCHQPPPHDRRPRTGTHGRLPVRLQRLRRKSRLLPRPASRGPRAAQHGPVRLGRAPAPVGRTRQPRRRRPPQGPHLVRRRRQRPYDVHLAGPGLLGTRLHRPHRPGPAPHRGPAPTRRRPGHGPSVRRHLVDRRPPVAAPPSPSRQEAATYLGGRPKDRYSFPFGSTARVDPHEGRIASHVAGGFPFTERRIMRTPARRAIHATVPVIRHR